MIKQAHLQILKQLRNTQKIYSQHTPLPTLPKITLTLQQPQTIWFKRTHLFSTTKSQSPTIHGASNYEKYNLEMKQVSSQNIAECIDLASRNFSQFQPLRQVFYKKFPSPLQQRIEIHNRYFSLWKDQFLLNQLSTVAYQKANTGGRQIIKSLMLAKDYSYVPPNINSFMNGLNIFSALSALYAQTKQAMKPQWASILDQPQRGKVAHFWLGATSPELASAKIFSRLFGRGQQKAVEKGYKCIVVWATNNKSGKISKNFNYECISSVDTHGLQVLGQHPFQQTPEENRYCTVWGKLL